ncbi:MAG: hypothetical protein FWH46_01365 [Methanimicrococcus sp.]|nr:hypothetical protein [Methanimicrococcus sp.]
MGLFNSEMAPQKAMEMLGSGREDKMIAGAEYLMAGGKDLVPFVIENFEKTVPLTDQSKRYLQTATNLYLILCQSEIPANSCQNVIKALINAPEGISFDSASLPIYVYENSYTFFEEVLKDGDLETKKKILPYLEKIKLRPTTLPILASLLTRESGFAEISLGLIPLIDGDLTPVSNALYEMLDLYPLGDAAMKAILELKDRLKPNIPKLKAHLFDFNSQVQKRAIKIAILLAENDQNVHSLLEKAIIEDESSRSHTLEVLEKAPEVTAEHLDLIWLILVHATSNLTEERGMKYFGRIEKQSRPLILWYAQNGPQKAIICAFKCMAYMKEEGPRICSELLPIYLENEKLLYEKAGLPAFPHIARIMKLYCAKYTAVPFLAKKMLDHCVQKNVDTPTEVMAILGPADLADIVEWSIKKIYDAYGVGYTLDYSETMLKGIADLVGFDKAVLNTFIKAIGFVYSFDSAENAPVIIHKEAVSAINRLRSVNTPATTNMLHLVSMKKDIEIKQTDATGIVMAVFKLSFAEHRRMATEELNRRSYPSYLPVNYLKNDVGY